MGAHCIQTLPGVEIELAARLSGAELTADMLARIRRMDDAYVAEKQRMQK